jgi:hypothetical protein
MSVFLFLFHFLLPVLRRPDIEEEKEETGKGRLRP